MLIRAAFVDQAQYKLLVKMWGGKNFTAVRKITMLARLLSGARPFCPPRKQGRSVFFGISCFQLEFSHCFNQSWGTVKQLWWRWFFWHLWFIPELLTVNRTGFKNTKKTFLLSISNKTFHQLLPDLKGFFWLEETHLFVDGDRWFLDKGNKRLFHSKDVFVN